MLCVLSAAQTGKHLLRTQNVSEQNQKHLLCPQQMLRARANREIFVWVTMCPQQCVLVCHGLYSKRKILRMVWRQHKPIQRQGGINKPTCKPIYHKDKHVSLYVLPSATGYKSSRNLAEVNIKYNVWEDDAILLLMRIIISFVLVQSIWCLWFIECMQCKNYFVEIEQS